MNRKALPAGCVIALFLNYYTLYGQTITERWHVFELTLNGPSGGNPFKEVQFSARFTNDNETLTIPGFYDGSGIYKVRFMPQKENIV